MRLPLDGYIRVSQVGGREGEGYISIPTQEREIREWAKRQGQEVVMRRPEENVSGGTMDRPEFNKIMERVRAGKSGGIVVYKVDRFARNLLGALTTLNELAEHDAVLASATEPELDYTSPAGRAFMQQLFVFAEFLRSTLKESWAISQRSAIERDIHISPNGYLGYDKVNRRLVPNGDAPTVVEVFERRGAGETWGALAEWLNTVAPKEGDRQWTGQAVSRLCKKRVYRGEASRYVDQDVDNRGPIIKPDAHPAIVTEAQWQAAQAKPRTVRPSDGASLPLLSGLIRCAGCRYALSKGNGPKGEVLYRCRAKHASGRCSAPASVLARTVDAYVEDLVLAELDGIARLVPDSKERGRAIEQLAGARADLDEFKRDTEARRKLGSEWHGFLDQYLGAVREAEAEVDRINQRVGAVREGLTRDHYLALSTDDRREVLAGFLDCVFVRRSVGRGRNVDPIETRARVLWRGQGPSDLPRRRVINPIRPFDFDDSEVEAGVVSSHDGA